jgi:hypothetical protein
MCKLGSVSFIVTALMVAAFVSLFASTTYSLQSRAIDKSLDNAGVQKPVSTVAYTLSDDDVCLPRIPNGPRRGDKVR